MKVIDLLNKIANGEIEEDIKIEYQYGYHYEYCTIRDFFERYIVDKENLNEEITIEDTPKEDKKIKRIQSNGENLYSEYIGEWLIHKERYTEYDELLMNKINEIIDKVNGEDNE